MLNLCRSLLLTFSLFFLPWLSSCDSNKEKWKAKELVEDKASINHYVSKNLETALLLATSQKGKIDDSTSLDFYDVVEEYYYRNGYTQIWSDTAVWNPVVQQMMGYLDTAELDGLYPSDYHYGQLQALKKSLDSDSIKRTDAVAWTKADLLLTDAFMHIACDLKQGRLQSDSNSWKHDTTRYVKFFCNTLDSLVKSKAGIQQLFANLQPAHPEYGLLKQGIRKFVDSMDRKQYTYLVYPYKKGDLADSLAFISKLQQRLFESGMIKIVKNKLPDSVTLANAITAWQKKKKLTPDGKPGPELVKSLNLTDKERFNRVAITLDRYKQMPASMPEKYIWVNLPGYYLRVHDSDSVVIRSKVICGKPGTPTPTLTSKISDLVIYPTWTVPESIIKKEMLPGLKRNPGYLARKGLSLYNFKGERIDPGTVNWAKYSKGIPYKIQQGSGEDNALGVIKFNFDNPHFVYLHDTNQRYLFKNSNRALSHGCVRVQEWQQLATFIARNDSLYLPKGDTLRYTADSISNWIAAKQRHRIAVTNQVPLYIRYFTCEGIDGSIKFYDDIYGEDRRLKEKYFPGK